MKRTSLVIAVLVLVAMVSILACVPRLSDGQGPGNGAVVPPGILWSQQQVGIWVNGQGKVTATPDVAILSVGVEAQASTVAQAQKQASDAMNQVINALKTRGVADKDIQTQQYSIVPVTYIDKDNQPHITGYRITNSARAKLRRIIDAGATIDAVATAGGDLTRIQGVSFTIDDSTLFVTQARELAMKDAAVRAKQMADVSGVRLGSAIYISESSPYVPMQVFKSMDSFEGASTQINAGQLDVTVTVQIVYRID